MERVLLLSVILAGAEAFMFDQLSEGLRCKGMSMLCPPMCQKPDSRGCTTCDCSNIDPSHPNIPNTGSSGGKLDPSHPNIPNTGSSGGKLDPSNPLKGHNKFPGSTGCDDWTKCACALSVNAATGCLECLCGNSQPSTITPSTFQTKTTGVMSTTAHHTSSRPVLQSSSAPISSKSVTQSTSSGLTRISERTTTSTKSTSVHFPGNQSNTSTSSQISTGTSPKYSSAPVSMTSHSTSTPLTSATSVIQTSSVPTSTGLDTNLPSIATVPALNTFTTVFTTSTLAPFVCPGIFSCSLDCYAGFLMDKNGCPECKCAPIPTDLP